MILTSGQIRTLDNALDTYVEKKDWVHFQEELNKKENEGYEIQFSLLEKFLHRAVHDDKAEVVDKLLKMPALTSALSSALLKGLEERRGGHSQESWLISHYLCNLPNDKQPLNMGTTLMHAVWQAKIDLIRTICTGTKRNLSKTATSDAILEINKASHEKYSPEQKATAIEILTSMPEPQNRPDKAAMSVALSLAIRIKNLELVKAILSGSNDLDTKSIGEALDDILNKNPNWDMIQAFIGSNKVAYRQLKRIDEMAQDAKKSEISSSIKESIKKIPTADLQTVLDEQVVTMIFMLEWKKISDLFDERPDYKPKLDIRKKLSANFNCMSASALSLIRYLVKEENADVLSAEQVNDKLDYLTRFLSDASPQEQVWINILMEMTGPNAPNEQTMTLLLDKAIQSPYINVLEKIANLDNSHLNKEHVKRKLDEISKDEVFYLEDEKAQVKKLLVKLLEKMPEPKIESKPKPEPTLATITSTQVTSTPSIKIEPTPKQEVVFKMPSTSTQPFSLSTATSAAAKETTSFTQPAPSAPSAPKDDLTKWDDATKLGNLDVIRDMIEKSPKITKKETTNLLYKILSDSYPQNRWAIMHILIKLSAGNKPEDRALNAALRTIITESQVGLLKDFPFNRLSTINIRAQISNLTEFLPTPTKERDEIKTILEAFDASINPSRTVKAPTTSTALNGDALPNKTTPLSMQSNTLSSETSTHTKPQSFPKPNSFISDEELPSDEELSNDTTKITADPAIGHQDLSSSDDPLPNNTNPLSMQSTTLSNEASTNTQTQPQKPSSDSDDEILLKAEENLPPISSNPLSDDKTLLNTITTQTTSDSNTSSATPKPALSPRKKECTETLDKILLELRNKIKDISPSYNSAILKQAQALCLALETSKKTYVAHLTNQDETIEKASKQFSAECSSSINNAKKAWGDKLGWGDSLTNLLKSILNAVIKIFSSNRDRLFTPVKAASSLTPIFEQAKGAIDLDLQTRVAMTP